MRIIIILFLFSLVGCKTKLSSCTNSYNENYNGSVKVGEPYTVKNITYAPELNTHYDEIGQASWYGSGFHCNKTANGEYFNKNEYSAAHKTLPMPCVAKVTNMENGKSINVIINDRGPFVKNRIIDLSENAAAKLEMKHKGVATVRVQFLPKETNALMSKINSRKKIFYDSKPKHKKEILIAEYKNQAAALKTMHRTAKFGKVHLIAGKNSYKVVLPIANKTNSKIIQKKLISMGYTNAKIITY